MHLAITSIKQRSSFNDPLQTFDYMYFINVPRCALPCCRIIEDIEVNGIISMKWEKWVMVFKNGPSKICGRQPLKNLKI